VKGKITPFRKGKGDKGVFRRETRHLPGKRTERDKRRGRGKKGAFVGRKKMTGEIPHQ